MNRYRKNPDDRSLTVHVDKVDNGEWIVSTLDYPVDGHEDVRDGPVSDGFSTKRVALAFAKKTARASVDGGDFVNATVLVDGDEVAFYKPRRSKTRKNPDDRSLSIHVDNIERGLWSVSSLDYPVDGHEDVRDGPVSDSFGTKRNALAFAKKMAQASVADGSFANATVLVDGDEAAYYR